jgi:hypothetical protein
LTLRRARAVRFPAGANVAQAFGHDAQAWAKYQCRSHARIFKGTWTMPWLRVECREATMEISQLRSGWLMNNENIRPGGTMENVRRIPMSL